MRELYKLDRELCGLRKGRGARDCQAAVPTGSMTFTIDKGSNDGIKVDTVMFWPAVVWPVSLRKLDRTMRRVRSIIDDASNVSAYGACLPRAAVYGPR